MRFGMNPAHSPRDGSRRGSYRPRAERLEGRELMAIDVTNVTGAAGIGPYGVQTAGLNTNGGAGYSVAEVGDVNGDGYDDFVIGSPSISTTSSSLALGTGSSSAVYLVFGSAQVGGNIDFRGLTPAQRVGDLSVLGSANQANPVSGAPGLNYNGLTIIASANPSSQIGASVAAVGDVNGDGYADFMIGAPNALNSNATAAGTGRAYLFYGGTGLNPTVKTVDLDNPLGNVGINVLTFVNSLAGAQTGYAVGSAGDVLADGISDIAIGAPGASLAGANSGGVYVVSGSYLSPARSATINVATVGQAGSAVAGVIFSGAASGDRTGSSVGAAGNFSGSTVSGRAANDLVLGAPQTASGPGQVDVIYAGANFNAAAVTVGNSTVVPLSSLGTAALPGAIFTGDATGDQTGFSVGTAGDFNADGIGDIILGAPGYAASSGRAIVVPGVSAGSAAGRYLGSYSLTTLVNSGAASEFDGTSGSLAGWSVTAVRQINGDAINEIAIGLPGFSSGVGAVYIIPGNPQLAGAYSLGSAESQPVSGLLITSNDGTGGTTYFGASVSGRLPVTNIGLTADSDNLGDLVVGSPAYALTPGRRLAGTGYLLEGAFLPVPNIVSNAVTSPIGVGTPVAPFAVNATTPADLRIYILSAGSNTTGFDPFRDINPSTIQVNGVPLPDPATFTQDIDEDGDGIADAYFTFSPRSLLGLTNGTATITVTARTAAASPTPNRPYTGTATVTVSGNGGGGGGGSNVVGSTRTVAFSALGAGVTPNLPYGEQLVPSGYLLNKLNYKKLPTVVAIRQFLPTKGFGLRTNGLAFPTSGAASTTSQFIRPRGLHTTLPSKVFTRGLAKGTYVVKHTRLNVPKVGKN